MTRPSFPLVSKVTNGEVYMKCKAASGKRFLRGDLRLFERLFVVTWENNRDCDITMPLSLKKTMEVQIKGDQ